MPAVAASRSMLENPLPRAAMSLLQRSMTIRLHAESRSPQIHFYMETQAALAIPGRLCCIGRLLLHHNKTRLARRRSGRCSNCSERRAVRPVNGNRGLRELKRLGFRFVVAADAEEAAQP